MRRLFQGRLYQFNYGVFLALYFDSVNHFEICLLAFLFIYFLFILLLICRLMPWMTFSYNVKTHQNRDGYCHGFGVGEVRYHR